MMWQKKGKTQIGRFFTGGRGIGVGLAMILKQDIQSCRLCADRFAQTATSHAPRPVVWFDAAPRIVIAGQAPGLRVHESGRPFTDPSGERLRNWMGLDEAAFYE